MEFLGSTLIDYECVMNKSISTTFQRRESPILRLRDFWAIYCCLTRQAELERLIAWAEKKRLKNPRKCYQSRLEDERRRIFLFRMRSPKLVFLARWLQRLNSVINPTPRYYRSGSAAGYRMRNLDKPKNRLIVYS